MLQAYRQRPLAEMVRQARGMGEILIRYNYPLAPKSDHDVLAVLKITELMIDGYETYVQYNKSDYGNYYLETIEVVCKNSPFLPFIVLCKLAKAFLGDQHLAYLDYFVENRRRYVWNVAKDKDDKVVPGPYKVEMKDCEYEGLRYQSLPTDSVDIH